MLFGGSLFSHGVAAPDYGLEFVLWLPSWMSPLRWAYELFYIIVITPLIPFMGER
jgi:hypothetical protein